MVEALEDELAPAARRRLAQALAMVIGTEAVLALRDVAGASTEEAVESAAWAARALVRQARAEAAARATRGTGPAKAPARRGARAPKGAARRA